MLSRRHVLKGLALAGVVSARPPVPAYALPPGTGNRAPTHFLIGYGSLVQTASRESTAGYKLDAVPVRVSEAFGFRRSWNAAGTTGSGFTALGLLKATAGTPAATINGVMFPVDDESLVRFDRREASYDRVAVPNQMVESISWLRLPERGTIWIYVPRYDDTPRVPTASHPIVQSYVDLVLEGALAYGEDFARELIETTFDWNGFWLNDRTTARRPWVANPSAGPIDRLLSRTPPAAAAYPQRAFSEEFTARYLMPQPARP